MQLLSGVVMVVWVAVKMLTYSVPYTLVSLVVTPLMVAAFNRASTRLARLSESPARKSARSTPIWKNQSPACGMCRLLGVKSFID